MNAFYAFVKKLKIPAILAGLFLLVGTAVACFYVGYSAGFHEGYHTLDAELIRLDQKRFSGLKASSTLVVTEPDDL